MSASLLTPRGKLTVTATREEEAVNTNIIWS